MNPEKKLGVVQENLLNAPDGSAIFKIDGPFGAASEDFSGFKVMMFVGGGIGVTPFGSILKHIRYELESNKEIKVEKVYFYWISRDKNAFEWFNEILAALEQENINNFLEIHTYLTGQLSVEEIKQVMHGLDDDADQITVSYFLLMLFTLFRVFNHQLTLVVPTGRKSLLEFLNDTQAKKLECFSVVLECCPRNCILTVSAALLLQMEQSSSSTRKTFNLLLLLLPFTCTLFQKKIDNLEFLFLDLLYSL